MIRIEHSDNEPKVQQKQSKPNAIGRHLETRKEKTTIFTPYIDTLLLWAKYIYPDAPWKEVSNMIYTSFKIEIEPQNAQSRYQNFLFIQSKHQSNEIIYFRQDELKPFQKRPSQKQCNKKIQKISSIFDKNLCRFTVSRSKESIQKNPQDFLNTLKEIKLYHEQISVYKKFQTMQKKILQKYLFGQSKQFVSLPSNKKSNLQTQESGINLLKEIQFQGHQCNQDNSEMQEIRSKIQQRRNEIRRKKQQQDNAKHSSKNSISDQKPIDVEDIFYVSCLSEDDSITEFEPSKQIQSQLKPEQSPDKVIDLLPSKQENQKEKTKKLYSQIKRIFGQETVIKAKQMNNKFIKTLLHYALSDINTEVKNWIGKIQSAKINSLSFQSPQIVLQIKNKHAQFMKKYFIEEVQKVINIYEELISLHIKCSQDKNQGSSPNKEEGKNVHNQEKIGNGYNMSKEKGVIGSELEDNKIDEQQGHNQNQKIKVVDLKKTFSISSLCFKCARQVIKTWLNLKQNPNLQFNLILKSVQMVKLIIRIYFRYFSSKKYKFDEEFLRSTILEKFKGIKRKDNQKEQQKIINISSLRTQHLRPQIQNHNNEKGEKIVVQQNNILKVQLERKIKEVCERKMKHKMEENLENKKAKQKQIRMMIALKRKQKYVELD